MQKKQQQQKKKTHRPALSSYIFLNVLKYSAEEHKPNSENSILCLSDLHVS